MKKFIYSKILVMCMFVTALCIGGNNTYENKNYRPIRLRRNVIWTCPEYKKPFLLNVTKTKSL
jgi:hypothetical protein